MDSMFREFNSVSMFPFMIWTLNFLVISNVSRYYFLAIPNTTLKLPSSQRRKCRTDFFSSYSNCITVSWQWFTNGRAKECKNWEGAFRRSEKFWGGLVLFFVWLVCLVDWLVCFGLLFRFLFLSVEPSKVKGWIQSPLGWRRKSS